MDFVLGVDAGNTKTIALTCDLQGNILSKGRSGCGDIYGLTDKQEAITNLQEAIAQALAPFAEKSVQACFCLAGADWPDDYSYLREQLERIGFYEIPSNDTWARDHGPICLFAGKHPVVKDFGFNGWGNKFDATLDDQITSKLFGQKAFRQNVLYIN